MLINDNAYIKLNLHSYMGKNSPRIAFTSAFQVQKLERLQSMTSASGASPSVLLLSAPHWSHYPFHFKPLVPFGLLCHIMILKDGT